MFQSAANLLRTCRLLADDLLGDPMDPPPVREETAHPHRRHLRWERERRPGTIPPPPMRCLSPLRAASSPERCDEAVR
jgi:hypothetical protein